MKYLFPTWGYSISNDFDLYSQVEKKKYIDDVLFQGLGGILPALQRYTLEYIIHVYITRMYIISTCVHTIIPLRKTVLQNMCTVCNMYFYVIYTITSR